MINSFSFSRKNTIVLRTQLSVRVHNIIGKPSQKTVTRLNIDIAFDICHRWWKHHLGRFCVFPREWTLWSQLSIILVVIKQLHDTAWENLIVSYFLSKSMSIIELAWITQLQVNRLSFCQCFVWHCIACFWGTRWDIVNESCPEFFLTSVFSAHIG